MRVHGSVNDAAKNMPLSDARVVLVIGDRELAVLFTDREGRFEHGEEKDYGGQTLKCRVGKEGVEPQEVTYKIEQDELSLEVELVPLEKPVSKPPPKPDDVSPPCKKWPKIAIGIVAAVIAYSFWQKRPATVPPAHLSKIPKHEIKTFRYPKHKGCRLDWCLNWAMGCSEPAASAWCRSKGYDRAIKWAIDKDIGKTLPTCVFNTGQVCRDAYCDGFLYITCTK